MGKGINKVIIVGNVGAEPEVRSLQNGGKVVNVKRRHQRVMER